MNAAAKVMQESNVFDGRWSKLSWDAGTRLLLALIGAVLLSAIAVVYLTNENRLSYMELQQLEEKAHAMKVYHGQLMLEQASLATAGRIENIAKQKLHMHMPAYKQQLILRT